MLSDVDVWQTESAGVRTCVVARARMCGLFCTRPLHVRILSLSFFLHSFRCLSLGLSLSLIPPFSVIFSVSQHRSFSVSVPITSLSLCSFFRTHILYCVAFSSASRVCSSASLCFSHTYNHTRTPHTHHTHVLLSLCLSLCQLPVSEFQQSARYPPRRNRAAAPDKGALSLPLSSLYLSSSLPALSISQTVLACSPSLLCVSEYRLLRLRITLKH